MRRRRRSLALLTRGVPTLVGWLVIVVAVDWGVGTLVADDTTDPPAVRAEAEVPGQIPRDPRADSPAMDPYPWSEAYFAELGRLRYEYSPYVVGRLATNEGRYVNTTPDGRRSYVPAEAEESPDAVDVWFLGGSTMFGEGQRDGFTIPSYVARLAEADGLLVRPHNLAQQGLVSWQELLVLERELARRPAPDLVVFYDGTNDFNAQLENPDDDPVHYDEADYGARFEDSGLPLPEDVVPPDPTARQSYEETSLVHKLLRAAFGIEPAGAQEGDPTPGIDEVATPDDVADQTRRVYLRTLDVARFLARDHGVQPFFFWQPVDLGPGSEYRELAGSLPDPVIDLSATLDDPPEPVFIDGGHTNELGAELVARGIYRTLRPALERRQ